MAENYDYEFTNFDDKFTVLQQLTYIKNYIKKYPCTRTFMCDFNVTKLNENFNIELSVVRNGDLIVNVGDLLICRYNTEIDTREIAVRVVEITSEYYICNANPLTFYTGAKGNQGVQGIQGKQGIQGLQGIQGIQGEKGDKGEQGEPGTLSDFIAFAPFVYGSKYEPMKGKEDTKVFTFVSMCQSGNEIIEGDPIFFAGTTLPIKGKDGINVDLDEDNVSLAISKNYAYKFVTPVLFEKTSYSNDFIAEFSYENLSSISDLTIIYHFKLQVNGVTDLLYGTVFGNRKYSGSYETYPCYINGATYYVKYRFTKDDTLKIAKMWLCVLDSKKTTVQNFIGEFLFEVMT